MDLDPFAINMNEFAELDSNVEVDTEEPAIPIPLTSAKGPSLTALKFEYISCLPEYPTSHIDGYAYVVESAGRSQLEMEQLVHEIQYAKRQQYGQKRPVYCPFFRCLVKKWTWKCSGINACEFLNSHVKSFHHTSVTETIWEEIQRVQKEIKLTESDVSKRNAYSYYRSKLTFFKRGLACIDQLPSCKPVFKRYRQMNVHGEHDPYIGCINETYSPLTKHHRGGIQGHTMINLQFLEDLFNKGIIPATEECGVFESLASRRKYCGRDHPQGSGHLQHTPCDVIFNALVPMDMSLCPYILFTSHGVHKHPPPPPSKTPERILQGVKGVIQQMHDPSLTTAQFLRSPQLEDFCGQFGASTLADIHQSLSNKSKIGACVQQARLFFYPEGQDLNGVIFLQNTNPLIKDYVQEYYHDPQGTMILCGFRDQIEVLSSLQSFEVDMSYKRIRSKDMNEVLFATFLPEESKIITLLRVFTNMDSTEGYYLLFKRVFNLIRKVTGRPILFDPIHGTGIHGIIVDMDTKQYTGLGKYLSEMDPGRHDVTWHLEHIIIFCRVHFHRSVLKVIGTRNRGSPLWCRMMSLLDCRSEDAYDELIELLIKYESDNVRNWAIQKKSPVIKAGLVKACSKIRPHYFDCLRNHTNAVEQSHQKSYASGTDLSLTEAVKNSSKLDKDDIDQYLNFRRYNIHHSDRRSNIEMNYRRSMSRQENQNRKRQRSSHESASEQSQSYDNESRISSKDLHRAASTNTSSLEARRQELELQKLEADIRKQEEEIQLQRLENERLELDLIERRNRIQASGS